MGITYKERNVFLSTPSFIIIKATQCCHIATLCGSDVAVPFGEICATRPCYVTIYCCRVDGMCHWNISVA